MAGKDTPVSKVLALPCRNLSLISTMRAEKATCGGTHLHSQRWDGKGKQNSGAHWPAEPASLAYLKNSRPERDPALEKKKCAAPVIHLKLSSAPTPRAIPNMNTHTHAQARTLSPRRTWLPTLYCSPSQIITKWIRITPTFATMATAVGCATADFWSYLKMCKPFCIKCLYITESSGFHFLSRLLLRKIYLFSPLETFHNFYFQRII